jgi:glycosyltransferase involved in cell wall biosynthesis
MNNTSIVSLACDTLGVSIASEVRPKTALRVAVVIPLYNGRKFIRDAIESVLQQTLLPAEIVVVDDGSTDDGPEIVARMAAALPITLLRKINGGQSSARNFGIAHTTSELIALLDQDDVWYPDHIERLVRPFSRSRQLPIGWVYGNLDEIDEAGRMMTRSILRFTPRPHPKRELLTCLRSDMFVLPSATIFSREAFDAVGGFDELLSGFEDDDLFLRIFRAGFENVFIDHSVTRWRIYSGSASFSSRMDHSRMVYFRKLLAEFPDEPLRDLFYARDILAPRFFPWIVREYTRALQGGNDAAVARAAANLQFAARLHRTGVRLIITTLFPVLRRPSLGRTMFRRLGWLRPLVRRLLR